jgi:hypothetical protein
MLTPSSTHIQEIFDSAVRVIEGSAHGRLDVTPLKSHSLHIRDSFGTLSAHGQA